MKFQRAIATTLILASCVGGPALESTPQGEERPLPSVAMFEGQVDSATGAFGFRAPGLGEAFLSIAPVAGGTAGVRMTTTDLVWNGTTCGANTFEGNVMITNNGATDLKNVYAEILTMSSSGPESCASDAVPRPGSSAVTRSYGLWAYGNIPAKGSVTRPWAFPPTSATSYTFTGRIITSGEPSSIGAGAGMGATINDVLADSDGSSLYVTVTFSTPPVGNKLFVLVDNLDRDSGMAGVDALTYDPTGSAGALSAASPNVLLNDAGADFDYYQVGSFESGTLTPDYAKTITGAISSIDAAATALTQDVAAGRYHFKIPYAALGASPADQVKVYVLYGQSNELGPGIHSAAPMATPPQITRMDRKTGNGLTSLAPAPPRHTLFGTRPGCPAPVQFAAIGDYGYSSHGEYGKLGPNEAAVATLVKGWHPDFIITVGDNDYDYSHYYYEWDGVADFTTDQNIGQYYASYIGDYIGAFGPGAAENAFFPTLGNHDRKSRGRIDAKQYFDYFTLPASPGGERYYDFVRGEVHFFALDSNSTAEFPTMPDVMPAQRQWLQDALTSDTTSRWKIVYFHHPPYTSYSPSYNNLGMRWPFKEWGATAVISGHAHNYERLGVAGFPYFVIGTGGDDLYSIQSPGTNSQAHFDTDHGAQRIFADGRQLVFEFIADNGTLLDTWRIPAANPCTP